MSGPSEAGQMSQPVQAWCAGDGGPVQADPTSITFIKCLIYFLSQTLIYSCSIWTELSDGIVSFVFGI